MEELGAKLILEGKDAFISDIADSIGAYKSLKTSVTSMGSSFNKFAEGADKATTSLTTFNSAQVNAASVMSAIALQYHAASAAAMNYTQVQTQVSQAVNMANQANHTAASSVTALGQANQTASASAKENQSASTGLAKTLTDMGTGALGVAGKLKDIAGAGVSAVFHGLTSAAKAAAGGLLDLGQGAANAVIGGLGKIADVAGSTIAKLGELAFKGAEAAAKFAVGFGKDSVNAFRDFEKEISAAGAVSGLSGDKFLEFKEKASEVALRLGKDLPVSASQAAKAITELTKAGLDSNAALGAAEGTALLAGAAQLNMGEAATITANTMAQFGLDVTTSDAALASANRTVDVLAKTANASTIDVKDLGKTFEYAGAVAQAAGFSLEDTASAAGALGLAGVKGTSAGTGLKMIMAQLASPTDKAAAAFDILGHKTKDAAGNILPLQDQLNDLRGRFKTLSSAQQIDLAKMIVGQDHFPKLLGLMTLSEDRWNAMADATHHAEGAAQDMATLMTDNLDGAFVNLGGTFETFQIMLGKALAPAITIVVKKLNELLVAALPLTSVIGEGVTKGIELVKTAMETAAPFIHAFKLGLSGDWKPEGIHSLGAAFATAGNVITDTWATLKGVFQGFKAGLMGDWRPESLNTLPAVFAKIGNVVQSSLAIATQAIKNFYDGLKGGSGAIETSSEFGKITIAAGKLGAIISEQVITTIKILYTELKPIIQTAFELYSALSPVATIFDVIVGALNGGAVGAFDALEGHVIAVGDALGIDLFPAMENLQVFIFGSLIPGLTSFWQTITGQIIPGVINLANTISTYLSPIFSAVGGLIFGTLIPSFVEIAQSIGANILPKISEFAGIVATGLKPILDGLAGFISGTLAPTLGVIGDVIANSIIPFVGNLIGLVGTVLQPVLEGLGGFINSTLLPIFTDIGNFIQNNVAPAFTAIMTVVNDQVMPALQPLAAWLGGALKSAFEGLGTVVNFVWSGIKTTITGAWNIISGVFSTIQGAINGDFAGAWHGLQTVLEGVWNGVTTIISGAWNLISGTFNTIKSVLSGDFAGAWQTLKTTIDGVWQSIGSLISSGWAVMQGTFNTITGFIGGAFKAAWDGLQSGVKSVWDGIVSAINSAWGTIQGVFNNFVSELAKVAGAADKALKGDFVGAWQTLTNESQKAGDNIGTAVTQAVSTFNTALAPLPGQTAAKMGEVKSAVTNTNLGAAGQQVGSALGDGMVSGMGSKMGAVAAAAARLAQSASAAAKANLQIASPSKIFTKIGEAIPDGVVVGVEGGIKDVTGVIGIMTSKITTEALEAAAKQAEIFSKIAETSKKIFEMLSSLRDYSSIGKEHITAFATDIQQLVGDFAEVQKHFEVKTLESTARFAESASKVVDIVGKGVTGLNALRNYSAVGYTAINAFATNIHQLTADFIQVASNFSEKNLESANKFADSASKIIDLVSKGVTVMTALNTYTPVASSTFTEFGNGIYWLITEFSQVASTFDLKSVTSAAQFADSAGKITDFVKKGVDGLNALKDYSPTALGSMRAFAVDINELVLMMVESAGFVESKLVTEAAQFADSASKMTDLIKKGVEGFKALENYAPVAQGALTQFARDINTTVELLVQLSGEFETKAVAQAGQFAESANKAVGLISNGAKAFNELGAYTGVPSGKLQLFMQDIELTVSLATEAASRMQGDMLKQIGAFGDATGKLFNGLKSAMDVFKSLEQFKTTPSTVIQAFVAEVDYTVGLAGELAIKADKDLLAKTASFGEATGKIFSGLKSAMDTFKSLQEFKGYPVSAMQNLLDGIIDAVSKMAKADDVAGDFYGKASSFYDKIDKTAAILKDAANKARDAANEVKAATDAMTEASNAASGGGASVPAYAQGTSNHPGGAALVAENKPEIAALPGGASKLFLQPTLTDLPKGTKVFNAGNLNNNAPMIKQVSALPSAAQIINNVVNTTYNQNLTITTQTPVSNLVALFDIMKAQPI